MARIRTIKPEFWVDDVIVDLDPVAKLLFIGMWNFCDDEGYIEDSVRRIKMMIFPGNDYDVAGALRNLLESSRIIRKDSDQGSVLKIVHFEDHQKISHPTPTKFTGIRDPSSVKAPEDSGKLTERSALIGKEGKGRERNTSPNGDGFDSFWSSYPRKVGKGQARIAYKAALKKTDAETIATALTAYARSVAGAEPKFIAHPTTWLNGERWTDDLTPARIGGTDSWMQPAGRIPLPGARS